MDKYPNSLSPSSRPMGRPIFFLMALVLASVASHAVPAAQSAQAAPSVTDAR